MVVGCCSDGTMKCYDTQKGYYGRADITFNNIHTQDTLVTKVLPFKDGYRLLTRA